MQELITKYCRELRLGQGFVENYPTIEADTHEQFLLKLLQMEVERRAVHRKNRLLKQAGFPVIKTFAGYSFAEIQIPSSLEMESLKTGAFIRNRENLILYGPPGTGKTHLATAIGIEACNSGKRVKFFRTATLVNLLLEAKAAGNIKKVFRQLEKTDLLICDEWGYIPFEKLGAQLLFQVISECYEQRSVIITTNIEFSKWNGIFYDEKLTTALIDRLVHHSHLLVFTGTSYRLKHSTINC